MMSAGLTMARFDVYRYRGRESSLVVDVQSNLLSDLMTRVVIPLQLSSLAGLEPITRLMPRISVLGEEYVLKPTDIGAALAKNLRDPIANIEAAHRDDVTRALDFLFQGF